MKRILMIILLPAILAGSLQHGGAQSPSTGNPAPVGSGSSQIVGRQLPGARTSERNAPTRDNLTAIGGESRHLRLLIGGFEQGAGLPLGLELTTAQKIPGIEVRVRAIGSTRLYQRAEAGIWIPAVGDKRTHLDLWVGYQKRTRDNLFGLGSRRPERPETNFATIQRSLNLALLRDLAPGLQIGLYSRLASGNGTAGDERGTDDLPIDQMFATNPASPDWLPGLNVRARTLAAGAFAEYDRRNDRRGLTRGLYLYGRFATIEGLENGPAADFGWLETELDGQAYVPIGSDETSLALRALTTLKRPRGGRQIPFYDLSWLGGRNQHRGYRNFRFRGNNALVLTIEPRRTILRQSETRGLDLVVFGDAGQVWGDHRPLTKSAGNFAAANWRYALGGGVQYRLNPTTALRVDLGQGREGLRVFFSVSRGF